MHTFRGLSVLLPVTDETTSLSLTLEILFRENQADVQEILLITGSVTSDESRRLCLELADKYSGFCKLLVQKRPYLGGALQDAIDVARGSHTLLMASDLETDPAAVKRLIAVAKENPDAIVTATRWQKGGGFYRYPTAKLVGNFLLQKIFAALFRTKLSDITYGFRIFPTPLVQRIHWSELRHSFLLETLIKPIRLGVPVREVAVVWKSRSEGRSHGAYWQGLLYLRVAFAVLGRKKESLLR